MALPPAPTLSTEQMVSLWERVRREVPEFRKPQGLRHPLASILCLATLAVATGCQGPEVIAAFAQSLNHGQRRRLRCSVRNTFLARNLSLLRSAAFFLFEHRPKTRRGKGKGPRAMPGWEQNNHRHPNALIRQLCP